MDAADRGSYRNLIRVARVALVLIGVVALAAVAVGWCVEGRTNASAALVDRFTELLDRRDVAGAAALTSYPNAAADSIRALFNGMGRGKADYRRSQVINLTGSDAFFTVDAAWHFGRNRNWAYSVQGSAHKLAVGWRISWDPQLLLPGLGNGRTAQLVRTYAPAPRVDSIDGLPLMTEQTVNIVTLDPTKTPDRVASANAITAALAPVASLITAASILQALAAAHGRPVTVVTLRDDVDELIEPSLDPIPGVVVSRQPKLIAADRELWSPMLGTLTDMWQASQDATSGWAVQLSDPAGNPIGQLAGYQGPPGPDITSTMDPHLQLAAENAVVGAGTAASIVMIRPSTGAVLAVAQNDQADQQGPVAFTGLYPAGDSLDLFTAGAAAAAATQPQDVSPKQLDTTLTAMGIGADPRVPGLTAVTGQVPRPPHVAAVLRDEPGEVQVSPFGMALAAATIDRGAMPQPMVVLGQSPAHPAQTPLQPGGAIDRMRQLLAQSAADPEYAAHLAAYPGLVGYTAYAGDDQWFIGYRGDLAFAIHIADATFDGGDAAARMAAWIFRTLQAPT